MAHEDLDDADLLPIAARELADLDGRVEFEPLGDAAPDARRQAA